METINHKQLTPYWFDLRAYKQFVSPDDMERLAMDSRLLTAPNSSVPVNLTTFFDNTLIEILTAKRAATEIFGEVKKGDRTNPFAQFKTEEYTGCT